MKTGVITCVALFVLAALLFLLQLWVAPIEPGLFWKLIVTLGVLFVVVLGVTLARHEYLQNRELKDKGYID